MSIAEFPEPCWVIATAEVSFEPHYPTRGQAVAECGSGGVVYRRPDLCWRVVCEGCGEVRDSVDVEGYEYDHHEGLAAAEEAQRELGPLCEDCTLAAALGSVTRAGGGVRDG